MTSVKYVRPNDKLVQYIADNMRQADVVECYEMSGMGPREALDKGIECSTYVSVVVIDKVPCAVVGLTVVSAVTGLGVPWLLGTNDAVKHKRVFINNCKQGVRDMRLVCPNLFNYVHAENRLSVKWLRWMGFTIAESQPMGHNGAMFHKFYIGECHV